MTFHLFAPCFLVLLSHFVQIMHHSRVIVNINEIQHLSIGKERSRTKLRNSSFFLPCPIYFIFSVHFTMNVMSICSVTGIVLTIGIGMLKKIKIWLTIFFNSFVEIQYTYHTIYPLNMYNSVMFSIFKDFITFNLVQDSTFFTK